MRRHSWGPSLGTLTPPVRYVSARWSELGAAGWLQTAHNASLRSPASPATLHRDTGLGGIGRFVLAFLVLSIIALEVFRHFL